jgi:hypothetical protein
VMSLHETHDKLSFDSKYPPIQRQTPAVSES